MEFISQEYKLDYMTHTFPKPIIGLYPDVGGRWFLNRAPGRTGLYMGQTGAGTDGAVATLSGFADRLLHSDQRQVLRQRLLAGIGRAKRISLCR